MMKKTIVSKKKLSFDKKMWSASLLFSLFLTSFLFFSCGGMGSKETENEQSSSYLTIEPIYPVHPENNQQFSGRSWNFTFKLADGEYMRFDNDEDYAQYCGIIAFISYIYFFRITNSIHVIRDNHYGTIDSESAMQIRAMGSNIVHDVVEYFNGNKENIKDKENLRLIDKHNYNARPELATVELLHEEYNFKNYEVNFNNGSWRVYVEPRGDKKYVNSNGEEVTEEMIVFHP